MARFSLRLPESLHKQLEVMAEYEGVSLNQYIVYALTKQSATAYQVIASSAEQREKEQAQYNEILNQLGQSISQERFFEILDSGEESQEPLSKQTKKQLEKILAKGRGFNN